ncbi:MAG: glycosyltransferase family 2 protein, partial [Candidatus Komeilibacteria bacterium]|nr:glycosyltransferase family 2 protein [Candidatus Komeilibacteria bacterium]
MRTLIIIPAYNEAAKIFNVVQQVKSAGYDVVVIDDGSADATTKEASRAGAKVLRHFINRGYGAALSTGMEWAINQNYDIAVHFDADGQHEVGDIAKLIKPIIDNQADVALGSRFIKSDPNDPNNIRMTQINVPLIRK